MLGCCKHIIVTFGGRANELYKSQEGLYVMEGSTNIEDEKSWKKYRPALASPASKEDYFLKSLAPDSVDVWKLVDASGNAKVRSKHVEESLSDLKHCPTDYTDWEYKSTQTGWKEADVKLICASDATSMYYYIKVSQ